MAHVGNTVISGLDEGEWEALRNARTAADQAVRDVEKLEQAASKAAAALDKSNLDAIGKGFEKVLQDFRSYDATDTKEIATPAITALASAATAKTLAGGQDFTAVAFLSTGDSGEGGQKVLALPGNAYVQIGSDVALFGTAAKKLRTLPQFEESAVAITKTAEGTATAAKGAVELTGGKAKDAINKLSSQASDISKLSIEGDFDVANSIAIANYQEMLRKLGKQKKENISGGLKELKLKYINVGKSAQKRAKATLKDLFKRFVELCKAVIAKARESYRRGRGMTKAAQEGWKDTEVAQESIRKRWAIDRTKLADAADEKIENGEEMPEEAIAQQLDGDQETLAADTERTEAAMAEENIDVQLAEVASIDGQLDARESVEATGDVIDGLSNVEPVIGL
ncbi:hypothetical protein SPFM20_00229 [Salmonella phage SPFM20]|nr:hypothetical protein SPFM8_00229 [Salmonella phage SPFM8]VFR14907.1 hypothetical protein SPFM20_00229 [Salmonella phage SPFM20]